MYAENSHQIIEIESYIIQNRAADSIIRTRYLEYSTNIGTW